MVSLLQNHMKTRNIKRKARIHILVLLITLLLLFNFPSQSAPQVIEENYYFIDQQFGGNNDLSLWTGSFIKKSSYATVNSTYATYDFNLDAWSTDNPLFLNTKGGFITFLTENGHEIYSTVSTGDQIIDVSAKFAGYRIPFYSTMSSNVAKPNSITIRLEYNNNYESIKLYTKLLYSLTGDREFGMDLALTDRNHQNTILGDKPINVMGSTLYASSFNKNARSIKIYDQSQYGDHDLTGDEALNMAGQLVKIPVKNNLYLRHDAAFSSINPFDGNTSIQYRIHFLTSANPYISDESAITEWNSLYHFYPLYISPEIDISHLVGFYGRFTVEVDITINTFSIESQPISDIYFILLNTFISSRVHDSPRTINENVKFAHDYARLGSEIIYDQNEFHVSATDDYIGTYMVDNSQLYISTKFDDGNFYADYTPANLPLLDNSFEYSDSLERPFVNSDIQYTTMDSMLLYTGLNQMDNGVYSSFWEKETYAFALDIKPEPTVSKTEMGIALGSGANYYFIKLHINPNVTKSEYRPYVSVHSYSTDGVGSINLLYEFDIDVDYFEFDPSLPSTLIVLNQGLQLDLYITQESAFYLGSFNGDSRILNLNSVGFVGKFGSLQAFELSGVENDELNKMYIAAKNPSDVDITLTVKTSTVGGSNGIIGELVIPANTPYNTYPLFIDETVKFSFIDRIDFYKNNPNKELILNYFILHGISQPGFMNRDASNYYRLGDYSYVLDKSVYQDNRFATYPDIIYDEAFIDNGFETAIALDQFMTSGNGSIQQIISKNEMQVFRDIGSIFATTQYSNIYEHQYTFSLPVNFNIVGLNPSEALLTYSYVAQNLAYGDSIEVLLSHPTYGDIPAFGADISRRTYVNFQSTRFNTRIVDYYLEDEVQPLITPTPMVTGSWNTIDVPLDGISLEQKDNQWKVVFTIITPAKLNRNIAPELYIDDFKIRKKLTYPMVFSIDTFLRAGPNRIELTGRATAKFSNENYIYATFTLAYRQLGGTDFTLINSGRIQMIGPLNTIVTKGVTFELLNSGKYELAVFYDVTRNETDMSKLLQDNLPYEIKSISNPDPSATMNAHETNGIVTDYQKGYSAGFNAGASRTLQNSGSFSELISFKKSLYTNKYGPRIGGFTLDRSWTHYRSDPTRNIVNNYLVSQNNTNYDYFTDTHPNLSNYFGTTDTEIIHESTKYTSYFGSIHLSPNTSIGDEWIFSGNNYMLPDMDPNNISISINNISWNSYYDDRFYAYVYLMDHDTIIGKIGLINVWASTAAFEEVWTPYGNWRQSSTYAPMSASNRSMNYVSDGINSSLSVYIDNTYRNFSFDASYVPTHIRVEIAYIPSSITMGSNLNTSTVFSFGDISYLSYNGIGTTSSYDLEFDLYKLSTYSGGNYTIHIDPFINLINYPFLELHIPFLIGQWRIGLLYNNTYYFSDLVRGYNRLNIHKLVNYDYSTNKTIDAIVLIAPNRISSLYFRELSIYTIDGLNFQFGPDANKYSSTWIEEGSIYTNANTGSTFDTKVTFTLNQTLWDLTQYQFFDFRTSSPVKIECVTNLGNTFIIDQLSAKGNFVGLTADPNLSHLSFVLNSTTAIDTFGLYNIPGVSLSLLGHDLFTPVIQSSDYLYSNNGGLEIHSSSSSLLFIDFDYFEVGQSRFVEVSVNDINLYDGAFYLSFNVGATTNSFGIDTSRLLTHRSINEQNPSGQQSMWLRVDGEVSTIVNSIKFYTISGWTFRDINDISNILDPNSVAYIGNLDTSRDIYNRFLRGEFSLIDLPIYMNNQNPNYPLYELALPDKTNYRHFDFSSSTEGFTGRNIQSTPSSIIVPQYNFNITLMYNGITALHGNFLIIRAKSQGINTRAYLDHISDGSNIFWQANDETYSLNTNYTIYSINLLNSPSQVNHSWLNSTNLYITFKTSLIETSSNGIEFDFITLTNDPTPALTYQGLEVYEQFSSVDSTKSFTEYTRFTSTGLTSTISVFMSTNVENSLMNDTDHIELIVRGSSSTPLLDFGYRVLGVNNTVEFISLGSLAQSFSLYRLYGMTEIPEFVLMNSYGDPIPENVYIEIGSVKLLSKGLNYNQNDIISNWNVISQFSDPQPVDNEFVRYIANGLSPLASITTRFSPSLLRKYNIMKFKFRASNSSIGDLLAIYDYVGSQLASAIPIFEITSNHLGTTTVIIDLSQHSFISTPHITLVSNSSIYGASIPLDSTDYIDIKDIEFISSNAFTPLQNVEEIDRDSSDIILDPFDTTSTVSTSNLIVDDPRLYNRLYVDFTPTSTSYLEISISVYDEYGIETILQLDPVISNPYAKVYENIRTGLLIPLNDPAWDDSKHFIFSISSNSTFGTTKFNFHSFVLINTLDISDGIGITSLDGIQWVNSLTDPFVTVDNNNLLSRTGTSTLHLRSDGTNGTISAPTESIPFDIYYISFDYFTINMQHGEKLRLLVNSSSLIQIEEIDLLTGLNRWTHYTKMINMSSSMNLYGAIGTSLIIQIIDNSTIISETNVLIDNIILKRLNPMFSITSTHFELGFENNPVIDLVMTPRQSGLEIFMDEGDGTNLISVKFDPTDMQVKILTNGTYYTTILYNFYFGLRYRISIITEPTKVLVNVWEATTERSEKSILREVTIVPQNGMKHFYANATNSNPHHSSLNHIFLQNSGFESGVDAQGYFDLTQGRVRHYSMDDDYLKLVDSMGNHLRTRDYSIRFDYLLEIGELRFNASGIYVIIQQYQIIINGITISIDQIEGSVYIEKYGSNVIVWLNDVSILHTKTYQDRDDIVTFFGNGIYEISNIFLNYERSSLRDSGKLVLEGPAFIMRFDSVIDLSRATYASFEVEMGSIEFITDRDTGMNWIIYDNLVLKATEILNMSGGSTRTFKFIHNGVNNPNVKSIFNGFSVLTGTNPVGFSSTLVNDTRFDNISSFNPRSFYLNNDLYFGLEGLDRDYSTSYFPHGFSEGVYQLQFYLDPNVDPSSDVNYAGVKFIVSTNQGIEEFIEIRISERTYEGSVYYFDGSDPNANDIREYNYYLDRASYSVTFGSSTGVTSNYNYNHVYQSWVRPAFRTVGGALEASQAIQDYVWSTVGLDSYVNNIDGWNVPTGSLRGLHQLDVYKLENSYFAFLDGKYITQFNGGSISDWGRSFYNSESIGFGVTKNAVAIRMDVREGSTLPVEGLEISGNYISIDNSLHLLPDGLSNTYVTTVNSFNLTDISHASISLSVNGDDTSISILPDLVGEFEIGVTVSTTSVGTYSNPSAYTSIIEGFAYNTSKIINLDFLFNPTPYNDISNYVLNHNIPFLSPPINTRLLLYGDTVSRDLGNSIDFAELINVKDRYRPRIATAGTGITIIQKLNFGTLEYTYEETSDTNYNPVVEGSGYFPTYALIGQVSHAANFTKYKNQLQREFILNGFTNGTIPISFNYYSKYSLRQYSKFNVTFSNLDNSVNFQLIFTRNYVWLKINGGMYFIGSYTPGRSIEAKLRIDTKSNTLFAGFSGKGFEYEINKTINNPVLTGDIMVMNMKSSLLQHESILIDNILIHGYSIEEFVGGLSDPYYQSKYSVFNVNINKNKELSARYLSVSVAPLLEYVNIELYIGSNYIGTKVATYNTLNSQQELVFYIDEDIDTTRIQNVYIKTDGIVRLYFIGYLEENNPDEVLVAHSGTGNAFNNAFQRIAFNEIKNGNQRIDSTSTNQYFVDNNFASTIELDGSITMTSTGKSLFTNGVVDPTATSYQFGIRDGAIDGFCTPAELGGYYNFSLFPNYQLDPLRCYQNFDTAYERPDASIIGIHTNNIPHWIIIQFNVRVGGIGGSSTVTMPFYLFVNVNGATGGPPVSYGIRNLSYLQSGSINKLGDLMDLNLAGVSDNYAWSTVNINSRGYVLIDLNNEINRFVGKMDALVDTKKIQFTGVLSNLLQNLRFWAPNQIPIATETPTVYEGADPMDFITGNIIGSSDGYDLTFDGFSGAGFYTSSSDPLIVYDFFFIKDPNYTKFVAAENRYSSYFGGVNGGNQWTKLLTSDTGDVDLALPTFTDPNKINSALITFTINSNTGSLARFRLKSNMPSLIYINEVLVATTTDITDNFHPYSVVGNTYLKGGSNTVRIIALHPSDRFSETNVVYTNVGSQANEWVVGFKLLADHGLSYDMVSGDQPGFTDDFISQWTSSTTLLNLFGKRYDEYMVNTEKNDLGIFHDSILLPGETFSLKSDPNFSSRMTSGITSEEATIQLLRASDLASAFYINNDVTDPEGKFIATSTFHSTIDYKPMVFRIFMKDFDNLYALIIDKYQLSKIDTYDPTLNQFIVVDRQTGTEVSSISSTITMSPFDEEYTVLQFEMPIIAGIHRISLATQLLSGQNITNFVDDGALDIGIQLQSKVGGNPSFLSDDIYTFLKPHEYDPMNFKENFRQYVGLSQDEEGGGGMSFTSLSKKHEGTRSLSSSWFMARDGTPHLKRETFVGFESDAGPCEALAPNSNLAQSGMIYTKITIDPGTAQQASAVYQSYVDYTANSQSGVSNLYNQLSYNSLDKYTVQLSQRTSNYRNDVISLSDYGFQLQILIDGYHLVFNNQTIIQSLDYRGKPVDLGYSTNDMVRNYTEFYSSYTNTSQLDAINSISTFSIPYDYGITYTNYLDAISGSFPYMYQDTEASFIIFDSGDVSGVLLPAKSFLKFETSDGLEFEINLLSGTVRTHQKHSFNSRVYKPYEGKTFIVDFYDIYGISESTILPTSIINIFQELTNSHWKPGIASGPATAFSFAKAQAFQDPNFFNMVNQLNTPPPVDDDDQIDAVAEAVSKGIQKASKYIKGALDYAKKVVETAAEDPSKAVDMIVEDVNGLYTEISDAIGDVSEWFINSVSVYYQYQCAIAYNLLAFGIKIVAKMYNAIKAMFNEYITEPLKKVFNDVSDFIAEIFYNFEQDTINDADDAEITASSEPTKPSYVKNRKDIQSANSLLDIALRWQLGSQIEIIAGYLDLLFNARRDMLFLTFWGAVFGSAVGFTYTMADLFPDWEEDQTTSSESYKKHIAIPTKFIGADVLMMDAPVKHLKGSDSMVKLKANIMEIIIKTFGFSLTYDITPIGSQPLNSTKNFQNYDVIARPNLDNSTWHYFFALKSDFRFPLTLRQLLPLIGINERFLSVLIDGARNLIFTSLSNWLGEGVINDYNNGYTVQQIRTRNPNHPMAAVLIPLLGDITTLLTRLDIGLVFTLGTENWGLVGLDAIDSFKMNAPAVGPGSGDDADSYKTDEFGTQTDEKKWSFNVGISDKTWIFIVELLMNFIPGYGDLIGVLQSFRDLIMGDTFLDKAISFVMLPMDLRSFGGEKVATEIARKGATETAKKGLEAGSKGVIKGFLGRLDNVVGKVGEKVFYAGGGSGMKNAFKTLFWPVIVLKRKLFGSSVPKSLFAVIEKSVGKHTDKLMKKVRNTVSESAGDAFEVVTKDNMDQLAKEFASETADVAKRLTGELEVIKKKLIDDIDLDFKDSGIQTKLSGGFDSLEKDAKIKEIDLWIKNPEFIKDMAAQEAGLKVFKGDWDKLMNPPKKPKPPSESAILFKLATSKLGSNLIEFFSYFGKFIGSLLKTIKEIAESIAGFGYLFKSGLDDVPLNKFNFIDIFKESDSDRYIDDLVASGKLTKAEAVDLRSEVHDILKSKGEFNANVCTRPAGTIDDNIELTCEISQKAKDQKINQYTTNLIKKAQENIRMKKVMQEVNEEGNPKELGFYLSNDELKQFDIRDIDTWPDSLNNAQDITVITGGKPFAEVGEKEIAEIRVVIFSRITDDLMVDVRKYFSEDMIGKSGIEDHLVKIKSSYLATRGKKIEIPDSSGLIAEIDGAIRSIEATIPYIKSLPNLQAGLTDEALLNLIKQSTSILKSSDNSFDLAIFLQKKDLLDNVGESVGNEYLIFIGEAKGRSKLLDQLDKKISMIKYGDNGGLPLLGQDYIVKHGGITAHLKNLYGTYNGEKFVEIPADKVNNVKQIITSAHKEYVKALNAARLQRRIPFLNYNKDGLLSEHSRHKTGLFELKEENGKITYLEPSTGKTRIGGEIFPKDLDPKSLLIDFSPDKLVKNGKVMKVPDKINGITKKDWFIHDVQMSGTDKIFKNSNGDLIELTPDSTVGVQIVEVHGDDATVKAFNDGINNLGSNNPFTYPNLVAVDLNNPDTLKDLIDNNVITKDESGGYFIKATVTDANGDVQYGELKLTLPDGSEPLNDRWLKSALIHYFQDTSNPASDIIRMYSTISYNSGSTWKADLASMERIKGKNDINVFGCEHGYGVTFPRYGSIQSYIENLYIKGKNVEIDQELSKVYESYYGLLYDKHALESLQKLKAELIQKNPEDPMIEQMDEAIEIINKQLESSKEAFETEIGPLKDINANKVNDMTKEFDRLFEEGLNDKIFGFSDATFEQLIDKLSKFNDDIAKLLQSTDLRFYTQANELSIDNDVVKELLNELQLYYYTTRKSTSKSVFNMGRNISYNRDNNLLRRNSISYEDNYLIGYDYLIGDIHDYGSNRLPNNNKVYMMDSYTNPPANGILVEDDKYWHELSYIDLVEYVLRPVKEFLLNLSPSDPVQMMVEAITYKVEKQVEFLKANLDRFYTRSQLNVSIFNDYYEMNMLKLNTSLIPSNINGFTIPSINVYITTDLSNIAVLSNGNYTLHPLLNYNGLPNENIFFNVNNYNQEEITHKINNGQIPLPDFNDFDNKYNMFIKLLFNYHQVITQFSKNIEDPFFLDLSSSFLDVASYQSMYSLYLASKLESLANVDKLTGKNGEVISVGQLRLMNLMEMLTNQIYSHDEGSFEFMNQIMLSMIAISKVTNFYQYSRTINSPHGNKIVNLFADFNIINHQYGYVNKLSFTNLDETNQLLLDADYDPLDYFYNQINEDKYYLPTQSSSVFRSVLEEYFTTEGQYLRSDQLVNEFSYSITQFHKDMYKLFDVKEKVFKTKLMQSIYDALKYKDKKYDTQLGWRIIAALNLLNRKHSLVDYPGNKFEIYIYTDSFNTFFGMID